MGRQPRSIPAVGGDLAPYVLVELAGLLDLVQPPLDLGLLLLARLGLLVGDAVLDGGGGIASLDDCFGFRGEGFGCHQWRLTLW